jgi:hypothetical protein
LCALGITVPHRRFPVKGAKSEAIRAPGRRTEDESLGTGAARRFLQSTGFCRATVIDHRFFCNRGTDQTTGIMVALVSYCI